MEKLEQWFHKPLTFKGRRVILTTTVGAMLGMLVLVFGVIIFS